MKRSKIFLGVTTCLLAVAGLSAAKRFDASKTRYYCTYGNAQGLQKHCISAGQSTFKHTAAGTKLATITYSSPAGTVSAPIYTVGVTDPNTTLCNALNCINQVRYNETN